MPRPMPASRCSRRPCASRSATARGAGRSPACSSRAWRSPPSQRSVRAAAGAPGGRAGPAPARPCARVASEVHSGVRSVCSGPVPPRRAPPGARSLPAADARPQQHTRAHSLPTSRPPLLPLCGPQPIRPSPRAAMAQCTHSRSPGSWCWSCFWVSGLMAAAACCVSIVVIWPMGCLARVRLVVPDPHAPSGSSTPSGFMAMGQQGLRQPHAALAVLRCARTAAARGGVRTSGALACAAHVCLQAAG